MGVEVRDVADGLWLWRQPHPDWEEDADWESAVSSVAVESRGAMETPLHLPEQRALVFADAMTAPGGVLRVWASPWHQERVLPALRALLALPFEHVLVAHGEPVHTRADFEAALEREPWSTESYA